VRFLGEKSVVETAQLATAVGAHGDLVSPTAFSDAIDISTFVLEPMSLS